MGPPLHLYIDLKYMIQYNLYVSRLKFQVVPLLNSCCVV